MKAHELASHIKNRGLAPLYLVSGEEEYLRDRAVATIQAAVLGSEAECSGGIVRDGGLDVFNSDILYADETDAAEIRARAEELPVFATRRLVLLRAADRLKAVDGEALLPYLEAPSDSTTLVFVAPKLDGRQKFTHALRERAVLIDCSSLTEQQLSDWIRREASALGVDLNEDAVALLKELAVSLKETASGALSLVRRELEKLAAYVPRGTVVRSEDVSAVRGIEPGASVFDLTDAISAGDRGRALRILDRNVDAGEAPLRILGSLAWQYRRIWKTKDLLRQGGQVSEAARALRMPPFKVREFLGRFPERHLRTAFQLFMEADAKLKGGSGGRPVRVMESLLLALCAETKSSGLRTEGPGLSTEGPASVPSPQSSKLPRSRPMRNVRTVRSRRLPAS
ncbi:MAG: DNA polymerase III subunit delta [Nitrospiraceae bacterium]